MKVRCINNEDYKDILILNQIYTVKQSSNSFLYVEELEKLPFYKWRFKELTNESSDTTSTTLTMYSLSDLCVAKSKYQELKSAFSKAKEDLEVFEKTVLGAFLKE